MEKQQEWKITFQCDREIRSEIIEETKRVLGEEITRAVRAALSRFGDGRGKITVTCPANDGIVDETAFSLRYRIRHTPTPFPGSTEYNDPWEAEQAIEDHYKKTPPESTFRLCTYRNREGKWCVGDEPQEPFLEEYETSDEAWGARQMYEEQVELISVINAVATRTCSH
jgi:hypothetical protein